MLANKKYASSKPQKLKQPATGQRTITELFLPKVISKTHIEHDTDSQAAESEELTGNESEPAFVLGTSPPTSTPPVISLQGVLQDCAKPAKKLFPIFDRKPPPPPPPPPPVNIIDVEVAKHLDVNPFVSPDCMARKDSDSRPIVFSLDTDPVLQVSGPGPLGGSREDPIILDSTPVKTDLQVERKPALQRIAPIFFAAEQKLQQSPKLLKRNRNTDIPYPTGDTQHIRGVQSVFISPPLFRKRMIPTQQISTNHDHADNIWGLGKFSISMPETPTSVLNQGRFDHRPLSKRDTSNDIPQNFRNHPAISRLTENDLSHISAFTPPQQNTWTDKWRPIRAQQVLGNEENAIYLREWLRTLELQSDHHEWPPSPRKSKTKRKMSSKFKGEGERNKRPRVIRAVDRKKGRRRSGRDSDEDDWIVDDDSFSCMSFSGDEEPTYEELSQKLDESDGSTNPRWPAPQTANIPGFLKLTNTILLVGPPGCGKTAAVYACAQELDWEVFEVYPGIGKRSAAGLDHLIGEVGKNHLIRKSQGINRLSQASTRIPPMRRAIDTLRIYEEVQDERIPSLDVTSVTVYESSSQETDTTISGTQKIRQSMVLLEEADILFKEDAGFWPGVVNLIKDCKRPLIMTCSDITLIPQDDLPLQTILWFEPCPTPLAVAYLQGMCMVEGHFVKREYLERLYHPIGYAKNAFDAPVDLTSPKPDLRKAINHLQFWCSHADNSRHQLRSTNDEDRDHPIAEMIDWGFVFSPEAKAIPQLRRHALRHLELASFVDGESLNSLVHVAEALRVGDESHSSDDEIGHAILFDARCSTSHMTGAFHCKEETMGDAIMQRSRGVVKRLADQEGAFMPSSKLTRREQDGSRVICQSQMSEALNTLVPSWAPHATRAQFVLEYEPWVRYMVGIDDALERETDEGRMRRIRRVTRSGQGSYERYLSLSTGELEKLRAERFI